MKTINKLKKQKRYSREDLLTILEIILERVPVEGFSRVLDVKEELGFKRLY
jgi:hypothetical protein